MTAPKPIFTQEWVLESIQECMERTGAGREEATRLLSLDWLGTPDGFSPAVSVEEMLETLSLSEKQLKPTGRFKKNYDAIRSILTEHAALKAENADLRAACERVLQAGVFPVDNYGWADIFNQVRAALAALNVRRAK